MLKPTEVIDEYYLEARCKILEIAAILDRYDRSAREHPGEEADGDHRLKQCQDAIAVISKPQQEPDRAEQVALIFSDK